MACPHSYVSTGVGRVAALLLAVDVFLLSCCFVVFLSNDHPVNMLPNGLGIFAVQVLANIYLLE